MGLFSSKKKVIVNTTVQQIFSDEQIPNSIKTGVLRSIIQEGSITEYVLEEAVHSIALRADQGYNWAKSNYEPGLPVADVTAAASARTVVLNTIAAEAGPITADYYKFGPLNSIHYGFQTLTSDYGYDARTNEISRLSAEVGFPVYLKNIVATYQKTTFDSAVQYSDMGVFEQWGPSPASGFTPENPLNTLTGFGQYAAQALYEVSAAATEDYITITYQFEEVKEVVEVNNGVTTVKEVKTIVDRGLTFSMGNYDLDADYHQARYQSQDGFINFFTYKDGTGAYPEIDDVQNTDFSKLGTYFPWIYVRYNKTPISEVPESLSPWYKQSKKLANFINLDYDLLADAINADPEIDDVAQAIIMFGVNPKAQTQAELEYLFEYFNLLFLDDAARSDANASLVDKFNPYTSSPSLAQVIQDQKFAMGILYNGITKRRVAGKIGKKGTFTGELISQTTETKYQQINSDIEREVTQVVTTPGYTYRKQVTDSVYEEVTVYNPSTVYRISGKKGHTAGVGDDELLIPVDRIITDQMAFKKKEELLTRALYLVVNTEIVVKVKWYQSTFFKVIVIIIAVIITIVSWGTAWQSLVAAAAIGTTAVAVTIAVLILEAVLANLFLSYVTKLFVKLVGPEAALLIAVVAVAYGTYTGFGATEGSTQAVWSERLLAVGNNLSKESTNVYGEYIKDLEQDFLDFNALADTQWKTLEEKNKELLTNTGGLNGLDFVQYSPTFVPGESPDDFYSRTVHSGNIGVLGFTAVEKYCELALTLPKLKNTDEDLINGRTV